MAEGAGVEPAPAMSWSSAFKAGTLPLGQPSKRIRASVWRGVLATCQGNGVKSRRWELNPDRLFSIQDNPHPFGPKLVSPAGVSPATFDLGDRRSVIELRGRNGASGRNPTCVNAFRRRTPDVLGHGSVVMACCHTRKHLHTDCC